MINHKKFQETIKWFPHEKQREILQCQNREVLIRAGRRFGKSSICGYIIVKFFLEKLLEIKRGKCNSVKIWIIAPTYELGGKVFEYVVRFLLAFDKRYGQFVSNRPIPQIKIAEGIWIQVKSATEPASLLGEELDLAVIDEAALIPEKIYNQYIYPLTISKSRKCRTFLISTPRGKNWFQKMDYILKEKNASFHFTTLDGVEVDEIKLQEIKKTMPELLFRQEFMAEYVDEAGTVFRNLDRVLADIPLEDSQLGHFYVMGVDLGRVEDYTAISVIDKTNNRLVHFDWFKGLDYSLQKEHIVQKAKRYNSARVIIDATGVGRPIYEDLSRAGVFIEDFTFSGKTKEELLGKLIVYVDEGYLQIPRSLNILVDEMKSFQYQFVNEKTGELLKNIKYQAPQGYHDDAVISLALAVWGLSEGRPKVQNPIIQQIQKGRKLKLRSYI